MPRVSAILPNFSHARFLKERVRSILFQTVQDRELIYVDDASTDASNQVMQAFAPDPRVTLRLHERDSGTVYGQRNEAAATATGEWLWFPNADDTAHPRFLERLLALADAHPGAALAHCRLASVDQDGCIVAMQHSADSEVMAHLRQDYVASGHTEAVALSGGLYLRTASAVLLRRAAFEAVSGFDIRLWGLADYDFYLRLLHAYDAVYCAAPLAYHRLHGGNTTEGTAPLLRDLGFAYAFAQAYKRMQHDPRYSPAMRQTMLRRLKARLFDVFAAPAATIPES